MEKLKKLSKSLEQDIRQYRDSKYKEDEEIAEVIEEIKDSLDKIIEEGIKWYYTKLE